LLLWNSKSSLGRCTHIAYYATRFFVLNVNVLIGFLKMFSSTMRVNTAQKKFSVTYRSNTATRQKDRIGGESILNCENSLLGSGPFVGVRKRYAVE